MWRCLSFLILCILFLPVLGQDKGLLLISGQLVDDDKGKPLPDVNVTVKQNTSIINQTTTDKRGKWNLELPFNGEFIIEFSKTDYVSKKIKINTYNIPRDLLQTQFELSNVKVGLFKKYPGIDFSVLNQPITKIEYNNNLKNFDLDLAYTNTMKKKVDKILEEIKKKKEEKEKNEKIEKQYNELISQADKSFQNKQYDLAKLTYKQAIALKPNATYPKQKIEEIENILTEKRKKEEEIKKIEEQYQSIISSADNLFKQKKYEEAKIKYNEALKIKTNEEYPKQQIEKITDIIKKMNEEKQKEEEYNSFKEKEKLYKEKISNADNMFNEKKYKQAKQEYLEASKLKPDEQYPKKQIEQINLILKNYSNAIKKGNDLFANNNFKEAKQYYEQALKIKPDEIFPKKQIMKINTLLKQQEEENKQLEIDTKYAEIIKKADELFQNKQYVLAKKTYQEALTIKKEEEYPRKQIAKINLILNPQQNKQSKKNYKELIQQADSLFNIKKYEEAIKAYKEAFQIKGDDVYAKNKIYECFKILRESEKNELEDGVTEEIIEKANMTIIQRTVVKNGEKHIYQKIKYKWGGIYYKKDGYFITKYIWDLETK